MTKHPLYEAFELGAADYRAGKDESNPYTDGEGMGNSHQSCQAQYRRGYRNTRKHDRFAKTIAARQTITKS